MIHMLLQRKKFVIILNGFLWEKIKENVERFL